jgi:very-short-patch-repair endonuclease
MKNRPPAQRIAASKIKRIAKRYDIKVVEEKIMTPYILDIYLPFLKIGIEIDGGVHDKQGGYDNERDSWLWDRHKIVVFRFKNEEVKTDSFKESIWNIINAAYINKADAARAFALAQGYNLQSYGLSF